MIPFSPPRIDDKIIEEVVKALQSGWITTGPRTKLFEKKIAEYCNVENVLAVNSWTSGAELLLYWYGIKEGDEVIVPVYTYCATANIVRHRGAKVIMVDVTSDFGIDISKIEKHITARTKAVIPVDIGGLPIDYDALNMLLQRHNVRELFVPESENQKKLGRILVLSDAAHSFGAVYNNIKVGSQADFTVFSFHAVKNLTTAEGGAICINLPKNFNNEEVYKQLNTLTLHGQNKDALAKTQKGSWEYDVIDAGFKCNMTDILASIGLVEFDRYENDTLPKRKWIFKKYTDALEKQGWAITPMYKDELRETSYHLYLLRIKGITLEERNKIIQEISELDVSVNVHYKPLPLLSYYKSLEYNMDDYPVAQKLWETEISLPVYYELTEEQINRVIEVVVESVNKVLVYDAAYKKINIKTDSKSAEYYVSGNHKIEKIKGENLTLSSKKENLPKL
jgi:dTDP-4-amino-4,6-dideoxygalactose transaminase